jgi:ABC-type multidrug transport system ATPase subunit
MSKKEPTQCIAFRNLSKTYSGGARALQGVSLEISPGMFGLLAPNGAGKSTLMKILATAETPDKKFKVTLKTSSQKGSRKKCEHLNRGGLKTDVRGDRQVQQIDRPRPRG